MAVVVLACFQLGVAAGFADEHRGEPEGNQRIGQPEQKRRRPQTIAGGEVTSQQRGQGDGSVAGGLVEAPGPRTTRTGIVLEIRSEKVHSAGVAVTCASEADAPGACWLVCRPLLDVRTYDVHSPRIAGWQEIAQSLRTALKAVPAQHLWVNQDCGRLEALNQNQVAYRRPMRQ